MWNRTIQSMTNPPEQTFSAMALSCHGCEFTKKDCEIRDWKPATSAHLLTPKDIGIVAALGDSITAGFAARSTSIFNYIQEARGVSWSIGGDEGDHTTCATLPNILRYFNNDLTGASFGTGGKGSDGAQLNRAVSAAKSDGIRAQAEDLVAKIKEMPGAMDKWKLVTLWIGGNDLCQQCNNEKFSPEEYYNRIYETVDYLRGELPRTLVNIPLILDVATLAEACTLVCGAVRLVACNCANSANKEHTRERVKEYQRLVAQFDGSSFNDGDDFAVVTQPFFRGLTLPRKENGDIDMSFFALDCFHMNTLGHRAFAIALWNNMITPVTMKSETWDPYSEVIDCPNEDFPYIFTDRTMERLAAVRQSQGKEGEFNAQSDPSSQEQSGDNSSGWSLGQIFGVTVGTAAAAYMGLVVVGVVVGGVAWGRRRRRRANPNTETIPLVKKL
jgi:phospholipase B1